MKSLQFSINIKASAAKVYNLMLGIDTKTTYEQWTALFNPSSTYEGSWKKGSKILFIGIGADGKKGGLVSEIVENITNRFVSIRHYGLLNGEIEITEGPDVEKWAGGLENYSFEENNGITIVTVDVNITEDFVDYMNNTYPNALAKLKEISE